MKKVFIILHILALCSLAVNAQYNPPPLLEKQLANAGTYRELVTISDAYYKKALAAEKDSNSITAIRRQMKLFERWKLYMGSRLEPDGTLGNPVAHVMEAYEKLQANPMPGLQSSHGNWRPMGPTRYNILKGRNPGLGRVNCVAFDPLDPDLLYVGTANGGLWRRDQNGNWTPLTDHLPSVSVSGLVVNYQNGNDIWILTGDGDSRGNQGMLSAGVFESHDGGQSWRPSGVFPGTTGTRYNAFKLVQDPQKPAVFFACTTQGLFRSENYCQNWTQVGNTYVYEDPKTKVKTTLFNVYSDLVFKPGDPNTVYTTTMTGTNRFRKSTDNGKTWIEIADNNGINSSSRLAIGVTPAQPNWVYLLAGPVTGTGMYNGIFGSVTSGDWFIRNGNTPNILGGDLVGQDNRDQSTYDLAIAIHPQNGTQLVTGGIDIWSSQNGGTTMTKRTHWDIKNLFQIITVYGYVHADVHNLTYNGNRLYACTDGGLAVSNDHGATWTTLWNGLNILQPYKIAGIETDENHWITGTQDNGTMYRNNSGMVVQHVGGGDGRSAIIDPTNVNNIWFTANETYNYSTDGGITSVKVTLPDRTTEAWPLLSHNIDNVLEQLIGLPEGIYKYYPNAFIFSNRGGAGNSALTSCPSSSNRFFAAQDSALWRSDNAGDSWAWLNAKSGFPTRNSGITDIAVSPANSGYVVVSFGGYTEDSKVYLSTNGGESWTNISAGLPNVATLSLAVGNAGNIYVGNELGVFFRRTLNEPWMPFFSGLPKCPVNDLLVNMTTGKLRAATYGRGVWETELYSPCASQVTLAGDARGTYYYESAATLSSSQLVAGGSGTTVYYKSEGNILLTEGMEVKHAAEGTIFKAYLGPCGTAVSLTAETGSAQGILPLPEELNTNRYPPVQKEAYWRLNNEWLEYYLPDYAKISISIESQKQPSLVLLPEKTHASGFFRIKVGQIPSEQVFVKMNGSLLKEYKQ